MLPANSLEAFLEVARSRHFTRAAKNLGLTQSALSQRILNLEAELEASLFVRDRAGVRLTASGEELLRYALSREAQEAELLSNWKNKDTLVGELRVAGFSSVTRALLLPALAPLLRTHPLRCSIFTRELVELPGLLRRGEADFVLLDREPAREGFRSQFLGYEENVLVRGKKAAPWYLDHDENDETTALYFRKFGDKRKLARRYLDEVYALLDGVKLGLGEAVLPRMLVEEEKSLEIVNPGQVLKVPVWIAEIQQPYDTRLRKAARQAIVEHALAELPQK